MLLRNFLFASTDSWFASRRLLSAFPYLLPCCWHLRTDGLNRDGLCLHPPTCLPALCIYKHLVCFVTPSVYISLSAYVLFAYTHTSFASRRLLPASSCLPGRCFSSGRLPFSPLSIDFIYSRQVLSTASLHRISQLQHSPHASLLSPSRL